MKRLIGKSLGNVVFTERGGNLYGNMTNYGVNASYMIKPVDFCGSAKTILMDLDGTTLTSEEFWVFVIEQTMQKLLGDVEFSLEEADIPFVSGFTTVDHLNYCLNKYSPDKDINSAIERYHEIAEFLTLLHEPLEFTSDFRQTSGFFSCFNQDWKHSRKICFVLFQQFGKFLTLLQPTLQVMYDYCSRLTGHGGLDNLQPLFEHNTAVENRRQLIRENIDIELSPVEKMPERHILRRTGFSKVFYYGNLLFTQDG